MALAPIIMVIAVGVIAGLIRRGRFASIARTRIRHPEFLAVAIICGVIVDTTDMGSSGAIALVGLIGGVAFTGVNLHMIGMAVIALGVISNLLPVMLNGSMPVRAEALVEAEMVTLDELDRVSLTGARELADDDTQLLVLGDTLPVRWSGQVISIGDLIMMIGLADVIANLMLQRRRRKVPPSALASLAALGWNEDPPQDGGIIDLRVPTWSIALSDPAVSGQPSWPATPEPSRMSESPVHD